MTKRLKKICCLVMCMLALLPCAGLAQEQETAGKISVLDESQIPDTPKGVHHYLLLCMDSWAANTKRLGFSDGMVLITVDESAQRIIATSFIRDTLVIHPDGKPGRLTYIVKEFGVQGLLDTINRHFGLRVEKYIMMDWSQVQAIVDAVGGVDLYINAAEASYLKRYAISPTSTYPAMDKAGNYHFKGHAAVIFMRCRRATASNGDRYDFGRTYRARTVLTNIATALQHVDYDRALKLLDAVMVNILDTNLSAADMMEAFNMAFKLRGTKLEQFRLPIDHSYQRYFYAGGDSELMDFEANRNALRTFMFDSSFVVIE